MSSRSRRASRAASSLSASRLLSAVPTVRSYSGPNRSCNLFVRRRATACQTTRPGTTTSQQGALKTVAQQPLGKVLLILVAVGLGGYASWRLVRGFLGHGAEASDSGFDRVTAFGSGLVYASLCAVAVKILLGSDSG